jgi:DNA-binding transcriptional regulator YiaG
MSTPPAAVAGLLHESLLGRTETRNLCVAEVYDSAMDVRDLQRLRRMCGLGVARTIRQEAGLSLTEAAGASDVDRTTIYRWERGRRRPRPGPAAARYLRLLEELVQ